MSKNYNWRLICTTHGIDMEMSCQTTGENTTDDDIAAQEFITTKAEEIRDKYNCSKAIENLVELTDETELA